MSARTFWHDERRVDAARNQHVLQTGRKPQMHVTHRGARMCVGRCVGTNRRSTQSIFSKTSEPGLYRVLL